MTSSIGYIGINPTEVFTAQQGTDGELPHKLGTIGAAYSSAGHYCIYKFVLFEGSTAAVAGDFVTYTAPDGYKNHEVTSNVSIGLGLGAGVLQAVIADGGYGWIQVAGFATLNQALGGSATDGDLLVPDDNVDYTDTDGALTKRANTTTATDNSVNDHACAMALDASDKEVVLFCPF